MERIYNAEYAIIQFGVESLEPGNYFIRIPMRETVRTIPFIIIRRELF